MKKKNLIVILIMLIVIFVVSIIGYFILNGIYYSDIRKGASSWQKDHKGDFDKTTIGALYANGYISNNRSIILKKKLDCRVIGFTGNKVNISRDYDCNLNDKMRVIPTVDVSFLNSDNFAYKSGEWIGHYKISLKFKYDLYNEGDISSIKFYGPYDIVLDNGVIMNDYIDGDYVIEVCLKNNTCISKDILLRIDTSAPYFDSFNRDNDSFEAIFMDDESGVRDVYYYISESDVAPVDISLFSKREYLKFEGDKEYYIWAISYNYAGMNSDIVYLGKVRNVVSNIQSGSGKGGKH